MSLFMGGATGGVRETLSICPLTFGTRGGTGGTMKMIFLVINLCFREIFSLLDRQRILNKRNFKCSGSLLKACLSLRL